MKALLLFAFCLPVWGQAGSRPFRLEELQTPPGYSVSVYARVTGSPRHMTIGPNGVLYVAGYSSNSVVAIPEAGRTVVVLRGLSNPHSLAFKDGDLYVAQVDGVLRFRDAVTDDLVIRSTGQRLFSLPVGGHATRSLGFGPDGMMYVSVGSSCNFCVESDNRRAAILRANPDGSGLAVYSKGLRNSVGFSWHPVTGELWSADNGGDGLGDNEPPEEINIVTENGDYGWPDCVGAQRPSRWSAQARSDRCPQTNPPELEIQAHSAPLGLAFYSGDAFPASFRNDVLLSFHGSWNRSQPTGYRVVRIRAAGGRAAGTEDFLWGFLDERQTASGRPVHIVTAPDGSVFISDDRASNIYRVEYVGPRIDEGGVVPAQDNVYSVRGKRLAVSADSLVSVLVNGEPAEVMSASDMQIDFVMPDVHGEVSIKVTNEVASDEAVISVQ